jgi:hypothetical protein
VETTVDQLRAQLEDEGVEPETARLVAAARLMRLQAGLPATIEDPDQIAQLAGLLSVGRTPAGRRRGRAASVPASR